LPYDVVFVLNHFFEAVAGAVIEEGGKPNQFLGDGLMAVFGDKTQSPREACRKALRATLRIAERLDDLNMRLANELAEPITIGVGLYAGTVIFGELGYCDNFVVTAIGDTVHVAARLQDLTKDYSCEAVISEIIQKATDLNLANFAAYDMQVRGRQAPVQVYTIKSIRMLQSALEP
jgi:adenylate cyclase